VNARSVERWEQSRQDEEHCGCGLGSQLLVGLRSGPGIKPGSRGSRDRQVFENNRMVNFCRMSEQSS
jgi:hypothetical protein